MCCLFCEHALADPVLSALNSVILMSWYCFARGLGIASKKQSGEVRILHARGYLTSNWRMCLHKKNVALDSLKSITNF